MATGDLVLVGARLWSAGWPAPRAATLAVRDGRILAVGPDDDVRDVVGGRAETIDLTGCLVLPGFQDAHVHPPEGGLIWMRCSLHDLPDLAVYEDATRTYAAAHPDEDWIRGGGWAQPLFDRGCPSKELLDAWIPDRPAYLTNRDGHGAWVNSRALEIAGVTVDTPDPPDGRIERAADGSPQGTLHEGAMDLVEARIPTTTVDEWTQSLMHAQRHLHSLGITAWQDAIVTDQTLAAYRSLDGAGRLTARVVGALWWDRHRGDEQIAELVDKRGPGTNDRRFRATSVKIMQDGICESFTAGMLEPYLEPEGRRGLSHLEPPVLKRVVTRLDGEGFQVHVHAIGDRAVREALDAFEAARATNGPNRDGRHHVAHLQVVHPDDVPRFAALGVTANAQPYWACFDDQMLDLNVGILGPERVGRQYPFRSLLAAGATMAMGSDWDVSTPDVMKEIQVAVTRLPDGEPDADVFLPEERLSLEQSLRAFTWGSAYVNHLDGETGTLEVGKLADLAVLDRDPFDVPSEDIGQSRVVLTLVEGEPVFEALAE